MASQFYQYYHLSKTNLYKVKYMCFFFLCLLLPEWTELSCGINYGEDDDENEYYFQGGWCRDK